MDRSSEFIKNKALFGGYPTQEYVNEYESMGVRYFIDLTYEGEKKITPYKTKYVYIRYPIKDCRVPTNWETYAQFIIKLGDIIRELRTGQRIYLHCKGGHGRCGIVVASLLCYLYRYSAPDALSKTSEYHNRRKEMREKWRRIGSPQTRSQKHFVTKFFEPLYIYNNKSSYFTVGFNNDIDIPVDLPDIGVFPTVTDAFNMVKKKWVKENGETNWDLVKDDIMYIVIKYKFKQHESIRKNLLGTGLRPIVSISNDSYWSKSSNNNHGKNTLGKLMMKLRHELYNTTSM